VQMGTAGGGGGILCKCWEQQELEHGDLGEKTVAGESRATCNVQSGCQEPKATLAI
jgi:hypothetical protein